MATEEKCTMSRWPYAKNINQKEFHQLASMIDRNILKNYLFFERIYSDNSHLSILLSQYLYANEHNKNLKGFYALLKETAETEDGTARKLNKNELCEIYNETLKMKDLE